MNRLFHSNCCFCVLSVCFAITDREFRSRMDKLSRVLWLSTEDGDVLMKRTSDLQLFRISLDIFRDDQAFVKTTFRPTMTHFRNLKAFGWTHLTTLQIDWSENWTNACLPATPQQRHLRRSYQASYLKIIGNPTMEETETLFHWL